MHILVLGASGSGTTTLGTALAQRLEWEHLDTDDFFWLPTSPPYQQQRGPAQRLALLLRTLQEAPGAVVSGSLVGWGNDVEDCFNLIVFLHVPTDVRLQRLRIREAKRFGQPDPSFLQWASEYDDGPAMGRGLAGHRSWLEARNCPVLRIEGDTTIEERVSMVMTAKRWLRLHRSLLPARSSRPERRLAAWES